MTDSALLATATAGHLALAALRRHRSRSANALSPFVLPSFLFSAAPWVFPSPLALAIGAAAHLAWFVACEVLSPPPAAPPVPKSASIPVAARQAPSAVSTQASGGFVSTPVLAALDETADVKTLRVARPAGFDFEPGQFVPVRVTVDGRPHVRCYSISSAPQAAGYLEISVRRQGLVSTLLHATARTGATLAIGRPAGQFTYPAGDDRPLALIAGGIGITPLLSMLRHAVATDPGRPIVLLYSARARESLAFLGELKLIAERHPQVRIGVTLSQPGAAPPWRTGRVDAAFVRQYVPHAAHTVFCLCGPAAMMTDVSALLAAEGVPASQIRFEQFETAVAATQLHAPPPAVSPAGAAAQFRVRFATSGRTAEAGGSVTLLEAAEQQGVRIPSSCRAGVCQACRTRLTLGEADCRSSVLDPEDRAAGFILPCVSWATSDCELEA
ncbi:MAG TPA: iron-sulfur cluster-binding domain-containing protein [Vicinamibacterales bacterium]|nr:iron-sulfur cluster-binding domain-containing protein [Vicinamibacterales bacterium]